MRDEKGLALQTLHPKLYTLHFRDEGSGMRDEKGLALQTLHPKL
jgi:hypothetical protein